MAKEPDWHPVDEEVAQALTEDPNLLVELREFDRAYDGGEVELVSDDEVRRRLEARGLTLAPRPADDDTVSADT